LKKYSFDKIFIGKWEETNYNNMNYKRTFDGNTILIKNNTKDNQYTFIGYEIYQFQLEKDDEII